MPGAHSASTHGYRQDHDLSTSHNISTSALISSADALTADQPNVADVIVGAGVEISKYLPLNTTVPAGTACLLAGPIATPHP